MSKQKELGQYMTPDLVADTMCQQIKKPVEQWKVLDPACGDGNLLLAVARIMKKAGIKNIQDLLIGVDIDPEMVSKAKEQLSRFIGCPLEKIRIICADFMQITQRGFFETQYLSPDEFNIVISNPPYGRSREYRFFEVCNLYANRGTELIFLVPLAFLDRVPDLTYIPLNGRPLGVTTGHAIVYRESGKPLQIRSIYGLNKNSFYFQVMSGIKLYELGAGNPPQNEEIIANKPYSFDAQQEGCLPCLRTGDIHPFSIQLGRLWVNYGEHLAHPKDIDRFKGPRLFVRRMPIWKSRQLGAAYIEELALCAGDVLVIKHTDNNIELLKGLCVFLNSPEAAEAVLEQRPSVRYRTSFPKLSAKDLNALIEYSAPSEKVLLDLARSHFVHKIQYIQKQEKSSKI